MGDISDIADKIRKVLALTKSSNANEAANAAALAQKLMQEHRLSEADVSELANDGSSLTEVSLGKEGFMATWKFALATVTARAFFCEAIALALKNENRRLVKIVGRASDADVAARVFSYLVKEVDRLADTEIEGVSSEFKYVGMGEIAIPLAEVRSYKESFRKGAAMGIAKRLQDNAKKFEKSSETAMVLVRKTSEETHKFLRNKYGEARPMNVDMQGKNLAEATALSRGFEAGAKVKIPVHEPDQAKISGERN